MADAVERVIEKTKVVRGDKRESPAALRQSGWIDSSEAL